MTRLSAIAITLLAANLYAAPGTALAQERFPVKPVRMIVSVAAGSPTDVVLRMAGQELLPRLGQPLIMDNRPGGAVTVGAEVCARAAPDGYTYCAVTNATMSINPHIYSKLGYDPERDFKAVTPLWYLIQGLIASGTLPAKNGRELREIASARPDALNFGTLGIGTGGDVYRQWLNEQWKTNIAGIPYKGANLIMNALISGEIQLSRIALGSIGGQLKADRIKLLAIFSSKRSRLFPEVPTVAEVGLDGFTEKVWWGLLAPAGSPDPMVRRINAEFSRLLRDPKFVEYLDSQLLEPAVMTPEEFAAFLKEDRENAGAMVKRFNVPRQ